jgi:hypothetical protein
MDKKNIARALLIVFILMVVFPPYEMVRNGEVVGSGFAFIGNLPSCDQLEVLNACMPATTKVELLKLIGQFLIAIMIAFCVFFSFKSDS